MKNMKKTVSAMSIVLLATTLVLAGCGSKSTNDKGSNTGGKNASDIKIGMVTDGGGVNDKSFNQSAWEGLQQLQKDTGASVKYLESKTDADYESNLNTFIKDGYNLTWGIGFLMADAVAKVAGENPDAKLASIDSVVEAPNVESVMFSENEGSFLAGVVAGLTTKSNTIGFVGGMETPLIKKFEVGFKAGIEAVNPNAVLKSIYAGDFTKPDLGKAAAATLYNAGADIIYHAAGGTGNGVFTEAKDRAAAGNKVWVIGVDKDQSQEFGNDITLTSMVKRVDMAVQLVSKDLIDGKFEGGQTRVLSLKDDAVGLPESNPNISDDIMAKVNEYKEQIVKGEITVPSE